MLVIPSPAIHQQHRVIWELIRNQGNKAQENITKRIQNLIIINAPSIHSFQDFEVRFKQVAFIFHDLTVLNRLIIQLHRKETCMTELLFYYFKPEIKIRTVTNISSCCVHAISR